MTLVIFKRPILYLANFEPPLANFYASNVKIFAFVNDQIL